MKDRLTAVLPWLALAAVWLLGIGAVFALVAQSLTLLMQRRIFGPPDMTVTVCDVPNFCATTGPEEDPLPLDAFSRSTQILAAIPGLILIGMILVAMILGTGVMRRISRGDAFALKTVRALGGASLVLLAGGAVTFALEKWSFERAMAEATTYINTHIASEASITVGMTPQFPSLAMLFGILGLAAWAAFRQGAAMREELDSVI